MQRQIDPHYFQYQTNDLRVSNIFGNDCINILFPPEAQGRKSTAFMLAADCNINGQVFPAETVVKAISIKDSLEEHRDAIILEVKNLQDVSWHL